MEVQGINIESVTKSDLLELATWNRQRSIDQLRSFVARRSAEIADMPEEL